MFFQGWINLLTWGIKEFEDSASEEGTNCVSSSYRFTRNKVIPWKQELIESNFSSAHFAKLLPD